MMEEPFFVNISFRRFSESAVTRPTQEVLILEAGHKTHQISIQDGRIIREETAV